MIKENSAPQAGEVDKLRLVREFNGDLEYWSGVSGQISPYSSKQWGSFARVLFDANDKVRIVHMPTMLPEGQDEYDEDGRIVVTGLLDAADEVATVTGLLGVETKDVFVSRDPSRPQILAVKVIDRGLASTMIDEAVDYTKLM